MNYLDRVIESIAPQTALKRAAARVALDQVRKFDSAKTGRRVGDWVATGTSANAEAQSALDIIRSRSRELVRNDGYAASAVSRLPAHIIGKGIVMRPVEVGAQAKKQVNANWKKFVKNSDQCTGTNFHAQMHLMVRCVIESGEALIVWKDTDNVDCPIRCDVLEPDYLDTGKTEKSGDNTIIQGVEFDATGRRVAYWMFDHHPGEVISWSTSYTSRRIDAANVDHVFDVLRPGQARGIPWLSPVALRMRDLKEFEEAELIRKKIEACFAVFINKSAEVPSVPGLEEDEQGRKIKRISPGMINYLDIGESTSFGAPATSAGIGEFMSLQLSAIAAGIGMTYSSLTGRLDGANYSSLREGKLEFWQLLDHWQWHMLVPMVCAPAWQRVHEAFARVGQGPKEVPEFECAMPARPWVDPDKDGKATERDLRIGRKTWKQMVTEAGRDPETQLTEIKDDQERLEKAGLDFGKKSAPVKPVETDDEDDGDAKKDDTDDD